VAALVDALVATVPPEPRRPGGPFLLAVDHCFSVRGQGTVLTGTVLAGSLQVPPPLACPALCA
jgi:selenocysteine-specific elongation factor